MRRVAGICSNPNCTVQTEGPSDKADKNATIGVAAHITAASKNGPRYDASLTQAQRKSADNGIWLCENCAALIDKNVKEHPVALLHQWKAQAEFRAKANRGKAETAHQLSSSQNSSQSKSQKKLIILPEQSTNLIGRTDILDTLKNAITQPQGSSHLLVNGMGGVGKTAICKKLAHDVASITNAVVWLDGQSGLELAMQSKLVHELEVDLRNPAWLGEVIKKLNQIPPPAVLFADNLIKTPANNKILQQLKTLNWHIVATSRIALTSFTTSHNVDVLPFDECTQLFKQHYQLTITDEQSLNRLITLAGRHTLTVELLAKIANSDLLELADLLKQVNASGFDLSELTDVTADATHSGTEQQTEREHQLHQHLAKLFELSSLNAQEQDILRLMAILPYQGYDGKNALMPWLNLDKASVLVSLAKKGWLQQQKQHFALHPVLAFVTKQQVAIKLALLAGFAKRFNHDVKPNETGHWIYQVGFIEHIEALITAISEVEKCEQLKPSTDDEVNKPLLAAKSNLFDTLGRMFTAKGQFTPALPFYIEALKVSLAIWGENSSQVATVHNNLGETYRELGQYQQAIEYYQLALTSVISTFGEDHSKVQIIRSNLGSAYYQLGQYEQAIEYFELALTADINTFGEAHPQVAIYRNNLGEAYRELGQYQQAIEYLELALTSAINNFGEDHPKVAIRRNNLAGAYQALGQYQQAIEYYLLALTSDINSFGEDHPNVATRRNNLAMAYKALGQYQQAMALYQLALDCLEQVLGLEHPTTKIVRNNLDDLIAKMDV